MGGDGVPLDGDLDASFVGKSPCEAKKAFLGKSHFWDG
jgi:hypothetical protein